MESDLAAYLPVYYRNPRGGRGWNHHRNVCKNYQTYYLKQNSTVDGWETHKVPQTTENFEKINLIDILYNNIEQASCIKILIKKMTELQHLEQKILILQEWQKNLTQELTASIGKQSNFVEKSIDQALNTYSADEIGLMDYAAAYAGGLIESISKDTIPFPSYRPWSLFKLINFTVTSNPEEILKPSILPGNCFAFKGSTAIIKVALADPIFVASVTISHASKLLLREDEMSSAPRDFQIYGFSNRIQKVGVFLGKFNYNIQENQHQTFTIDRRFAKQTAFKIIQLDILNNHGKSKFTCLYRFRVHGEPAKGRHTLWEF